MNTDILQFLYLVLLLDQFLQKLMYNLWNSLRLPVILFKNMHI